MADAAAPAAAPGGSADAPPAAGGEKDKAARLESKGRLRVDIRLAENLKSGKWRVLARLGAYTVDLPIETQAGRTEFEPGLAGAVLGDGGDRVGWPVVGLFVRGQHADRSQAGL